MNYHVFIVNENTFKYHLKYGFAGIGASNKISPFIFDHRTNEIHSTTERNLVGMIADVSRIRIGDKIIFYLQASNNREGMFFGVFKSISTAFFDENNNNNYLKDEMDKGLSFRIMIESEKVYPFGITEHEYLDSLAGKNHPCQMCWSLIYRKLKGARGCTMITEHEYLDLLDKLKSKNTTTILDDGLSYDSHEHCIIKGLTKNYEGKKCTVDILPRLLYKSEKVNAFEVHLQAYLLQNFDREPLKSLLLPFPKEKCWIGNEVSCGVGMQRIDLMIVQDLDEYVYIKVIELKHTEPYKEIIINQIPWYIQWVTEYIAPNYIVAGKKVYLTFCVIAKSSENKNYIKEMKKFNENLYKEQSFEVCKMQNISFDVSSKEISFKVKN